MTLVDIAREVHAAGMTVLLEVGRVRAVFPSGEQTLPPAVVQRGKLHWRAGFEAAGGPE